VRRLREESIEPEALEQVAPALLVPDLRMTVVQTDDAAGVIHDPASRSRYLRRTGSCNRVRAGSYLAA